MNWLLFFIFLPLYIFIGVGIIAIIIGIKTKEKDGSISKQGKLMLSIGAALFLFGLYIFVALSGFTDNW